MIELGRDTIETFASLFHGRTDAWGSISAPRGRCNREPVTLEHYEKHVRGEVSLGIYPLLDDGTCNFFAIDLDKKDFNLAKAIRDELTKNNIPAYIAESKSKGYHIYGFAFEGFVAREIRSALYHILDKLNINIGPGSAEIFPKQDCLIPTPDDPHPVGNYINLPCFGNTRPFLSGDMREVPLKIALERIKFVPQEAIERVLRTIPKEVPKNEPTVVEEYLRGKQTDDFNYAAVKKLLDNCAFIQLWRDYAATLPEPHWWSMIHILSVFGEPGTEKIHQLSQPYPKYTERETEQKITEALKAAEKEIGPHTCLFIEQGLGFACPENCQAKSFAAKSPAGLASKLAAKELHSRYFYQDKNGNLKLDIEALTRDILMAFNFATLPDTEEVLFYDDGYWRYGGEERIKEEVEKRAGLSKLLTTHAVNEIIGHIQRSTYKARQLFNQQPRLINLRNGILDIKTRELKPHTPEFLSTIRIPAAYDPNADCPRIKQFLAEVLEPEDIPVIHELAGYGLIADYSIQRAFLFIGDGSNGKSALLSLLRTFVGRENCSTVPWHSLEYSRFASSRLDGKLLNIYADLPSRSMDSTGVFKMLTGGDAISGEKKFKDGYSFINFARLVFSANKPPRILDEDSYAFWRRWIIINLPNQFPEDDPKTDPEILAKLTTESELSGFLNLALDGLQRLLINGKFSYHKTVDQTQSYYLRASDPVYAFVEDCCELDPDAITSKDELFDAFKNYCRENRTPLINRDSFAKALKNNPHFRVTPTRPLIDGERVHYWKGVKLLNRVSPVSPLDPFKGCVRRPVNGINKVVVM